MKQDPTQRVLGVVSLGLQGGWGGAVGQGPGYREGGGCRQRSKVGEQAGRVWGTPVAELC